MGQRNYVGRVQTREGGRRHLILYQTVFDLVSCPDPFRKNEGVSARV